MHQLIASPFVGDHLVVRPGYPQGLRISRGRFLELRCAAQAGAAVPQWLVDAALRCWELSLAGQPVRAVVLVREPSAYGYGRASYELNFGCNYACEHCYLDRKVFAGLRWAERRRLLEMLRDAGVLWLQLTGGEPLIDPLFAEVYTLAWELGMMVSVSSNGSRLDDPRLLELLGTYRPYRVAVSVYGATAASYEGLTRRRGSFAAFTRGVAAAHAAGVPIRLNLIVTRHNAAELDAMIATARRLEVSYHVYANLSPTISGGAGSLRAQAMGHRRRPTSVVGCRAGRTFFHVDPQGMASICKVSREPQVRLLDEGLAGVGQLGEIADRLLSRRGGCAGCRLSAACGTCMPLAELYHTARAPRSAYCHHPGKDVVR